MEKFSQPSNIKVKFNNKFKNLSSKIHQLSNKKRLFILLIILIALPITLILASQQQIFEKNAAELSNSESIPYNIEEDNIPDDVVPFTDPQVAQKEYDQLSENIDSTPNQIAATSKPNIIVIMLDDVNPMDGRFFTKERMPATYNNIVSKGINFINFYGETSLCCPGRVGFLTGQHSQNHKVVDLDGTRFNPTVTIATELQAKGYFTMLTGKYINNYKAIPQSNAIPPGWNKFDAIYGNNGAYYNYQWISKKNGPTNKESSITYYGSSPSDYSTDVIANTAVMRLKEAPINKPIFAFITPYSIHGPKTVAPRYINSSKCANIPSWKAPNVWEEDVSDKSEYIRNLRNGNSENGYSLKTNCEVLLAVDDLVRRVKNTLEKQGRLQNTIFILTADNGFGFGEHRIPAKTTPYTTNVPLYVTWPSGRGITPKTETTVLSNIDLAETFCELAGCSIGPYPNGQTKSDGISFLSLIKNQPSSHLRYSILESQPIKPYNASPDTRPAWWAIRTTEQHPLGRWHYIEYNSGEKELYDLSNEPCHIWTPDKGGDPCELNNILRRGNSLSDEQQIIVTKLSAELDSLKKQKGFKPPTPYPSEIPTGTPALTLEPTQVPDNPITSLLIKTFIPIDDAHVRKDNQDLNYGTLNFIRTDGNPGAISYLKFDLTSLKDKSIQKAILKLTVSSYDGANANLTNYPVNIKTTNNSWNENTIKYNNRPALGVKIGSITGRNPIGTEISIDITSSVTAGNINSFALESTGGADGISFNSKEASSTKPKLIITYQ